MDAVGTPHALARRALEDWLLLAGPLALIASMYAAFQVLTRAVGFPLGYLCAFVIYWTAWCAIFPACVLGPRTMSQLFQRATGAGRPWLVLVLWPIAFPLLFAFLPRYAHLTWTVVIVSGILGSVTGVAEELLWRGVYVTRFPDNVWLNTVYPSIAFGLWHLCPLSVVTSRYPGGSLSFAMYSVILGLSYATYARRTRSILACTVSHAIHDSLGLGGLVCVQWMTRP
jgi:CAAX protease family protein